LCPELFIGKDMKLSSITKMLIIIVATVVYNLSFVYAWSYEVAPKTAINSVTADSSGQKITIYCSYGGVWQTENGGLSWAPLGERFDNYSRAKAVRQE
jgi:hypothetical protein